MGVIDNQREVPPELDNAGEFAALLDGIADGFGGGIIDGEHSDTLHTQGEEIALNRLHSRASL